MPFDSGDGRYARFEDDGSITSWGDGERTERWTPEPKESRERTEHRETEYREAERRDDLATFF